MNEATSKAYDQLLPELQVEFQTAGIRYNPCQALRELMSCDRQHPYLVLKFLAMVLGVFKDLFGCHASVDNPQDSYLFPGELFKVSIKHSC